jgi:hypothetical protein
MTLKCLPILAALAAGSVALLAADANVVLDAQDSGRTFEGLGAVSAGASSRLLMDYPEPQRSEVLDYLFKPGYGAALQHLKVEIGGEVNSTDGTEPTHQRVRGEENYQRGYEWWLMKEAKRRNPAILLDCLAWGAPGWIGNGNYYSQDMADYVVKFIKGAKSVHGLDINFTGVWNEKAYDTAWIKLLRATLDAAGLRSVRIVAADEWGGSWNIVNDLLADAALSSAVYAVGAHYPGAQSPAAAKTLSQPIWSSEDGIGGSTWADAVKLAKLFNRNYVNARITKTEIWSPITSYYDSLLAADSGLMRANTPWSGSYTVAPAIWAVAHTTQFAWPGWQYLDNACGLLPGGGSYVALVSTNRQQYSVVIETAEAAASQSVSFQLTNGLTVAPVRVWRTSSSQQFTRLADVLPSGGSFTVSLAPGCLYTLTTTSLQGKGTAMPPAAKSFPMPYKEEFETNSPGTTPRYLSDQAGTFEVVNRADGHGRALRQVLPQAGIRWFGEYYPYTVLGEAGWRDYEVSADVLLETNRLAFVMGRMGAITSFSDINPKAYFLTLQSHPGRWELYAGASLLASGSLNVPTNAWLNLRLAMQGSLLTGFVNHTQVVSVLDTTYSAGLAGLGCGWHAAQFDNFTLRRLHGAQSSLAQGATASASSTWSAEHLPAKANDADFSTRWNCGWPPGTNEWLALDFGAPTRFSQVSFAQFDERILGYRVQHWTNGAWADDALGGTMGSSASHTFAPVMASKVRLLITNFTSTPSIYEFAVVDDAPATNLALSATATASSVWSSTYAANRANDNDSETRWNSGVGTTSDEWLQFEWPAPVSFNRTVLTQFADRVTAYRVQYWTGSAWADAVVGGQLGASRVDRFPTVTTTRARFFVASATASASIYEFQVFNDPPLPGSSPVRINEWMLNNTRTLADPADSHYEPWFELWNVSGTNVNLAGCHFNVLTTNRTQFQIPAGYAVPPGGALLVWADAEPAQNQPGRADLHTNFRLVAGQTLSLYAADGRLLDAVPLEAQPPDASQGSKPDGDPAILPLSAPTPRVTNKLLRATSAMRRASDGALVVEWSGMPFGEHQIEFSADLAPASWSLRTNLTADALGNFRHEETWSATEPQRFLRGVLP